MSSIKGFTWNFQNTLLRAGMNGGQGFEGRSPLCWKTLKKYLWGHRHPALQNQTSHSLKSDVSPTKPQRNLFANHHVAVIMMD
jgi:hypothetical protein